MKTILVVDDEFDMTDVLEMLLQLEGFNVLKAYDGREGLRLAETQAPDLVLTDLMMPKMDGMELARRLQEQEHTSDIPIVMTSARPEPEVDGHPPYDVFLEKPVEMRRLIDVVQSMLN